MAATEATMKLLKLFVTNNLGCVSFNLFSILVFVILPLQCVSGENDETYISNYDVDITSQPTYEEILYKNIPKYSYSKAIELNPRDKISKNREKRQVRKNGGDEVFRQLNIPQIDIPFRDMATFVTEAEKSINERLEVLEPKIYQSSARQIPKSPEWFMSASSKIKVIAKNMSRVALIAEEATKYLAKRYGLNKNEITFGLPLADVRGTKLSTLCQIKVDFPCQPGKYRAYNGYCNNVQNPNWGVSNRRYLRYLPPEYADGISVPRQKKDGSFLKSPREISVAVHTDEDRPHPHLMIISAVWGQFIQHDVSHTPQMAGYLGQRLKCCNVKFEDFHPECYPIKVSENDPFYKEFDLQCQEYARSATASRTGCTLGPREQINQVTSFIDGSTIYGSSKSEAEELRTFSKGQMKIQRDPSGDELLPADDNDLDCRMHESKKCFKAGDVRVNEHPSIAALHTLWLRQHNRVARELTDINPHWNDEQTYQETRRIVGAQIQHITYSEFLPVILGKEAMDHYNLVPQPMGFFNGYDINTNPGTANSVSTAAFRFITSLLPDIIQYYGGNGRRVKTETFGESFYKPDDLYQSGMLDHIFRGLIKNHAQAEDIHVGAEMTNKMFVDKKTNGFGLDLVAQIIQQGRDHGLPSYKEWRKFCGLPTLRRFDDLRDVMSSGSVSTLRKAYGNIEDIDLFTGGLAEVPTKGAVVGPTFACLLGRQMFYYKTGDRYWYENDIPPSSFTREQLNEIRKVTLAHVICENINSIDFVQPNVFLETDPFLNALMPCRGETIIQKMNLNSWATASPRFIVPDNMLLDAIERAKRDVSVIKDMEWNLWNTGQTADPKSPSGSSYGFMKPKVQAAEISNSSYVLQFASRRFLDRLLGGEEGKRANRQLKDAEFGNKGIGNLRELMDVLPNIDVSDVMEIPKGKSCFQKNAALNTFKYLFTVFTRL